MKTLALLFSALLLKAAFAGETDRPHKIDNIVIMREITVEGEFENPAFIIVPKAKLYKRELFKKSYYNDIVRDIYFEPVQKRKDVKVNKKRR